MPGLKGWRTILFNLASLLVAGAAALEPFITQIGLDPALAQRLAAGLAVFIAVVNLRLRMVTDTPVGRPE